MWAFIVACVPRVGARRHLGVLWETSSRPRVGACIHLGVAGGGVRAAAPTALTARTAGAPRLWDTTGVPRVGVPILLGLTAAGILAVGCTGGVPRAGVPGVLGVVAAGVLAVGCPAGVPSAGVPKVGAGSEGGHPWVACIGFSVLRFAGADAEAGAHCGR